MTGQSNDAAERSAHVQRGGAATASDALHPVVEWRNAAGQTVACARGVAELRQRVADLEALLKEAADVMRFAARNASTDNAATVISQGCHSIMARAALTPRPPRADAAPAGWDTGENVR